MRHIFTKAINLIKDFYFYFQRGWQAGLIKPYAKFFFLSLLDHLNRFRHSLYSNGIELHTIGEEKIKKLQTLSKGLYSLLPHEPLFTYSVLIVVTNPNLFFFKTALDSVLNQSCSDLEILIGLKSSASRQLEEYLLEVQKQCVYKLEVFNFPQVFENDNVMQKLVQKARGNFLFFMGEEDWMRPDLLFRYEQILRAIDDPQKQVVYCNLNALNERNAFIPSHIYQQPSSFNFPYFFRQFLWKGVLVPSLLWNRIEKHHLYLLGAEDESFLLNLDLVGANFQHVPLSLYSVRSPQKPFISKSNQAFLTVLDYYSRKKHLNWQWQSGNSFSTARALPSLSENHLIQVIIPYKDQKELTIKCLLSLLRQKHVQIKITAVNNCSSDQSITDEIQALGAEVITIDEPFNYSRLNNLAVKHTIIAQECDVLLFLNNDVELESNALSEMLRWIDQPQIGIVGCRLNYPDGRLQHGGVRLNRHDSFFMRWDHIEKLRRDQDLDEAKVLGIVDAVTAACAMIKRQTFLDIGGFDEIWYPIGYSDTNLAVKLKRKGLKCFYTPYAIGIHHESVSRKTSIEDFENTWWLHQLLETKETQKTFEH